MRPKSLRRRIWVVTQVFRIILSAAARMQIFTRVTVIGRENVPAHGRVIVCPNHRSSFDPIIMFGAMRRNVAFLAKASLFRVPVFGAILRWMGNIPVARGTDAAKEASDCGITVLENDGVVVVFPEGTVTLDGELLTAKSGMSYMAYATGSCVVPVALVGTERVKPVDGRWHFLKRVVIIFGRPIPVPDLGREPTSADRDAFTELVMGTIADQIDQANLILAA